MTRRRTTRHAVLGMLAERPMTGYELRQEIAGSIGHFWSESFGQLYPTLRELEAEGLVEALEPDERRIPYRITAGGMRALRTWLAEEPESLTSDRNALLLRVVFGRHAAPGVIRGHLERHRDALAEALRDYRATERALQAQHSADTPYWLASIRYGIAAVESALRWTERTLTDLEESA